VRERSSWPIRPAVPRSFDLEKLAVYRDLVGSDEVPAREESS